MHIEKKLIGVFFSVKYDILGFFGFTKLGSTGPVTPTGYLCTGLLCTLHGTTELLIANG